jgi:hypothetical protein
MKMDLMKLYDLLNKSCNECEKISDSYGNRLESFLILDDLAICFCFNDNDELLNCWFC